MSKLKHVLCPQNLSYDDDKNVDMISVTEAVNNYKKFIFNLDAYDNDDFKHIRQYLDGVEIKFEYLKIEDYFTDLLNSITYSINNDSTSCYGKLSTRISLDRQQNMFSGPSNDTIDELKIYSQDTLKQAIADIKRVAKLDILCSQYYYECRKITLKIDRYIQLYRRSKFLSILSIITLFVTSMITITYVYDNNNGFEDWMVYSFALTAGLSTGYLLALVVLFICKNPTPEKYINIKITFACIECITLVFSVICTCILIYCASKYILTQKTLLILVPYILSTGGLTYVLLYYLNTNEYNVMNPFTRL